MEESKELQLKFKTGDGKTKTLTLLHPADNLTKENVQTAMNNIIDSHAFVKDKVPQYASVVGADYVERSVTPIFNKEEA